MIRKYNISLFEQLALTLTIGIYAGKNKVAGFRCGRPATFYGVRHITGWSK